MSSILTNTSSMVALQTLKSVNNAMSKTQDEISTGKSINSAKDNSAVWSISKVMESDMTGFKGISDSLTLGVSTVAVARNAAETTTDLLTQIKQKIVQAQDSSQDTTKIQADISALRDQIGSVVNSAQFNGMNLVNGGASMDVLSSLDRDSSGNVSASKITVAGGDLSSGGYIAKAVFTGTTGASTAADAAAFTIDNAASGNLVVVDPTFAEGDSISVRIGDRTVTHTLSASDVASATPESAVATSLRQKIEDLGITGVTVDYDATAPGTISITNNSGADLSINSQFKNAGSGGLAALAGIDVTSDAAGALSAIDGLIDTAVSAAASFGTSQTRLEIQQSFVSKLTDSMKSGIGAMVDANMEEASARLTALQVQQQLGVQALSMANQAPQSILSLFR